MRMEGVREFWRLRGVGSSFLPFRSERAGEEGVLPGGALSAMGAVG